MLADVAQHPSFLEDRFRIVLDLQAGNIDTRQHLEARSRAEAIRSVQRSKVGMRERPGASRAAWRRLATPRQPEAMTRIPSSAPAMSAAARRPASRSMSPSSAASARGSSGRSGSSRRASSCAAIDCFVESAVAAGVDEPREQLRVVAVTRGLAEQAHQRAPAAWPMSASRLRVELVRDRQARVELEGAAEGLLGARLAVGRCRRCTCRSRGGSDRGAPSGREARVQLQAALVQVARLREPVVGARQLVRRAGRARRRARRAARRASASRPRRASGSDKRLHHAPGDVVLQPEQIAERRLDRVRREQRPARRLDELRRRLAAGRRSAAACP